MGRAALLGSPRLYVAAAVANVAVPIAVTIALGDTAAADLLLAVALGAIGAATLVVAVVYVIIPWGWRRLAPSGTVMFTHFSDTHVDYGFGVHRRRLTYADIRSVRLAGTALRITHRHGPPILWPRDMVPPAWVDILTNSTVDRY